MSPDTENRNKVYWLTGFAAFLLVLLVIETGILIRHAQRVEIYEQSAAAPAQPAAPAEDERLPDGDTETTLSRLHHDMDTLFKTFMTYGPPLARSLAGNGDFAFAPAVDLEESSTHYILRCDLPGLQKEKIDVSAHDNLVTLSGVRENQIQNADPRNGLYTREVSYGSFSRTVTLPGPVDETGIQARYENGVLIVSLPKTQTTPPQKVAVQ